MLLESIVHLKHAEHEAIEHAAVIIETEAKESLGHYQSGWPPLKPDTIAHKATGDSPLLERGQLRDSLKHNVSLGPAEGYVGTDEKTAEYMEYGTSRGIPPRPFLLTAAVRKEAEVVEAIGRTVVATLERR